MLLSKVDIFSVALARRHLLRNYEINNFYIFIKSLDYLIIAFAQRAEENPSDEENLAQCLYLQSV